VESFFHSHIYNKYRPLIDAIALDQIVQATLMFLFAGQEYNEFHQN